MFPTEIGSTAALVLVNRYVCPTEGLVINWGGRETVPFLGDARIPENSPIPLMESFCSLEKPPETAQSAALLSVFDVGFKLTTPFSSPFGGGR
jgi:hypothetical protein